MRAFRLSTGFQALPALVAVALSGCGQNGGLTPTLGAGVSAPDGAGEVLAEFVSICSAILLEDEQPGTALAERGWQMPASNEMAALGGIVAERADADISVQLIPYDFPHLDGMNCAVSVFDETAAEAVDVASLDGMPGFAGKHQFVRRGGGEQTSIGRWSGVAADGAVITINAMKYSDGQFVNLSMNKSKPVEPAQSETQ